MKAFEIHEYQSLDTITVTENEEIKDIIVRGIEARGNIAIIRETELDLDETEDVEFEEVEEGDEPA